MQLLRFSPLFLLPALAAQNVVSPANFASAEGSSNSSGPFGITAAPYRYLQVHDDLNGTARTIHGFSVRRDGTATTTAYAAYSMTMDVFMSNAATTAGTMSTTFDSNHGANKVQVAAFQQVNFPATTAGTIPRPFEYRIPLAQPYSFNGTGGLCWEVRVLAVQNGAAVAHDMVSGTSANPACAVVSLGTGCKAGGKTSPVTVAGSSSMSWTNGSGSLTYTVTNAPNSGLGILAMGTSNTNFSGIPLPFDIPGTSGAVSGVCRLYNSFAFTLTLTTSATGGASTNLGVPATPLFYGARLFGQTIFADTAVTPSNPLGLVTSNQVEHNWVPPYGAANTPVGRVLLANSTGATGTATSRAGLVVLFD
jgi:hypothetical protein